MENEHRASVQEELPGPWSEPGGTARGKPFPSGPTVSASLSTRAGRDAQRPSRPSGGLASPASGGAAQRPTLHPRPALSRRPPRSSALESRAAALIVPEPGTVGCRGESRGRSPRRCAPALKRGRGSPDLFPRERLSRGVRASKCGAWPRVPESQSGCRRAEVASGTPGGVGEQGV